MRGGLAMRLVPLAGLAALTVNYFRPLKAISGNSVAGLRQLADVGPYSLTILACSLIYPVCGAIRNMARDSRPRSRLTCQILRRRSVDRTALRNRVRDGHRLVCDANLDDVSRARLLVAKTRPIHRRSTRVSAETEIALIPLNLRVSPQETRRRPAGGHAGAGKSAARLPPSPPPWW